jgi:hypothetical protein
MRRAGLGAAYMLVLGMEAVATLALSNLFRQRKLVSLASRRRRDGYGGLYWLRRA